MKLLIVYAVVCLVGWRLLTWCGLADDADDWEAFGFCFGVFVGLVCVTLEDILARLPKQEHKK